MFSRGSLNAHGVNGLVLDGGNFVQEMDGSSAIALTSSTALTARRRLGAASALLLRSTSTLATSKFLGRTARYTILVPAERRRIVIYGRQRDARIQRDQEAI